jgi:hypothetical protein
VEGSGLDIILDILPAFAWRDCGKLREKHVTIFGIRAEI